MVQLQSYSSKLDNKENGKTASGEAIQNWLVNKLAQQLSLDSKTVNVTEPLTRYGLDSIDAVTMVGDLEDWLDLELPSTLFWDYPTIEKSAQYLEENFDVSEALNNADYKEVEHQLEEILEPSSNDKGKGWGNLWSRISGN
ncbi:MAG: acyl carrier protein [Moorea sp. SIO2B7]|nr:acyl carrier protein [Moorena sp. SIO2B7]